MNTELEKGQTNMILKAIMLLALVFAEFTYFYIYAEEIYLYTTTSLETNPGVIVIFIIALVALISIAIIFILMLAMANSKAEKPKMNKTTNVWLYILIGLFILQTIVRVLASAIA
jgi:uncharacterized membrane protein YidH (DUF202 family)